MEAVDVANLALVALGQTTITTLADSNENARRCNAIYEPVRDDLLERHSWNFSIKRATLTNITKPSIDAWVTDTAYVVDDVAEYLTKHYTCLIAHTSDIFSVDLAAVKWGLTTSWITATQYIVGDQVYNLGISYTCLVDHTSVALFATDLTAVKWVASVRPTYEYDHTYYLPTDLIRPLKFYGDYEYKIEGGYLICDESEVNLKYIASVTDPDDWPPSFVMALAYALADNLSLAVTNSRTIASDVHTVAKEKLLTALATDSQGGGTPEEPLQDEWINAR